MSSDKGVVNGRSPFSTDYPYKTGKDRVRKLFIFQNYTACAVTSFDVKYNRESVIVVIEDRG
jgi:hypothetical protein